MNQKHAEYLTNVSRHLLVCVFAHQTCNGHLVGAVIVEVLVVCNSVTRTDVHNASLREHGSSQKHDGYILKPGAQ